MEKTATPQAKPKNKHFWNFQPASGDNPPELILYGDIASETWWGDEVTPRQFTEELDALGAVPEIVVRINSGGGDVFAANAIYRYVRARRFKAPAYQRVHGTVYGTDGGKQYRSCRRGGKGTRGHQQAR